MMNFAGFTQRHPNGKGWQVSVTVVQILTEYREQVRTDLSNSTP